MDKPGVDTAVTTAQVTGALNYTSHFDGATPGTKKWHEGIFEPWALSFGYPEGKALYGEATYKSASYHIYYLNDGNKATIILDRGQKPQDYGVEPKA